METDISNIDLKKETKNIMKFESSFIYFNVSYGTGLFCFLILFYANIQNIFLTNFIILMSIIMLIIKLVYWFSIRETLRKISGIDSQKSFLLRLVFCMLTYITPAYCIVQEPHLVVSHHVSTITFAIVTILAVIGILMERRLIIKSRDTISL